MARHAAIAAVLLMWLLAGCSSPSAPDPVPEPEAPEAGPPTSPVATAMVDVTNAERTRAGLPAFRTNSRLMQAAQIQAEQVAAAGRLEHTLPDARYPRLEDRLEAVGYRWQAAGENLAFGQRDAAHAVESWMASSGHLTNILNGTFTDIGTGHVVDASGRPYHVQVFARPAS